MLSLPLWQVLLFTNTSTAWSTAQLIWQHNDVKDQHLSNFDHGKSLASQCVLDGIHFHIFNLNKKKKQKRFWLLWLHKPWRHKQLFCVALHLHWVVLISSWFTLVIYVTILHGIEGGENTNRLQTPARGVSNVQQAVGCQNVSPPHLHFISTPYPSRQPGEVTWHESLHLILTCSHSFSMAHPIQGHRWAGADPIWITGHQSITGHRSTSDHSQLRSCKREFPIQPNKPKTYKLCAKGLSQAVGF